MARRSLSAPPPSVRALTIWLIWATAVFSVALLLNNAMLGDLNVVMVVLLLIALILGSAWLCVMVLAFLKPRATGRDFLRLGACPLIGVAVLGLVLFNIGFQVRFELSEASLVQVARAAPPTVSGPAGCFGAKNNYRPVRAGLFEVRCAERQKDGSVILYMRAMGFPNQQGFSWSPDGELGQGYHLNDHWERWSSGHY